MRVITSPDSRPWTAPRPRWQSRGYPARCRRMGREDQPEVSPTRAILLHDLRGTRRLVVQLRGDGKHLAIVRVSDALAIWTCSSVSAPPLGLDRHRLPASVCRALLDQESCARHADLLAALFRPVVRTWTMPRSGLPPAPRCRAPRFRDQRVPGYTSRGNVMSSSRGARWPARRGPRRSCRNHVIPSRGCTGGTSWPSARHELVEVEGNRVHRRGGEELRLASVSVAPVVAVHVSHR